MAPGGPDRSAPRHDRLTARSLVVDLTLPYGAGSTAPASGRITLLDGTAFGIARERWEVRPTANRSPPRLASCCRWPLGASAAASAAPQEATAHLRDLLVALGLLADDGSIAHAIESLVHQPALLVGQAIDGVTSRHDLAAALRRLLGARPADAATRTSSSSTVRA